MKMRVEIIYQMDDGMEEPDVILADVHPAEADQEELDRELREFGRRLVRLLLGGEGE